MDGAIGQALDELVKRKTIKVRAGTRSAAKRTEKQLSIEFSPEQARPGLPPPALHHDPFAYRARSSDDRARQLLAVRGRAPGRVLPAAARSPKAVDQRSDHRGPQVHECLPCLGSRQPVPDPACHLRADLPDVRREVCFRILLFKLFNKIETWQLLKEARHDQLRRLQLQAV